MPTTTPMPTTTTGSLDERVSDALANWFKTFVPTLENDIREKEISLGDQIDQHQTDIQSKIDELNNDVDQFERETEIFKPKVIEKKGTIRSLLNGSRIEIDRDNDNYMLNVEGTLDTNSEEVLSGCLVHEDHPIYSSQIKGIESCLSEENQHFIKERINDDKEYNKILSNPNPDSKRTINEYHRIHYPFDLMFPVEKSGECLNLNDDGKLNIKPCSGDVSERFQYTPDLK